MARGSGSAFQDKRSGKLFAVVSVGVGAGAGKGARIAKHCPRARDLAEARERARVASELVKALRDAQRDTPALLETTVEECASAPFDKLEDVRAMVAALLGGRLPIANEEPASKGKPRARAGVTYGDVAKLWTSGDLRRRFPDIVEETGAKYAGDVRSKLDRFVLPVVRNVPIATFTLEHAQRVMARLPATLSKSSRKHVANFLRRVLTFAVYPLRLITANPIPAEFIPKAGRGRERNMLFVDEDRALLGCTANPIELRLLFGFQAREGMRREEACALEWRSVDLDRGWVYLDKNKTDAPRDWRLDAGVAEALARWRKLHPRARYVFGGASPVSTDHLAHTFRECLQRAGVNRPQLHEATRDRMAAGTHDLRGTFVTLAIAQGKGEGWIRRRTGHTTSNMIERYRRNADNLAEGEAAVLDPLWLALPELHVHVPADPHEAPAVSTADSSAPRTVSNGGAASSLAAIQNEERAENFGPFTSSGKRDSNSRPSAWEADALPTELFPRR